MSFLERRFELAAHGTTIGTEVLAGLTTFLTMAYIVFVQPTVLGAAGMDFGAVMVATCLSTALATTLIALPEPRECAMMRSYAGPIGTLRGRRQKIQWTSRITRMRF